MTENADSPDRRADRRVVLSNSKKKPSTTRRSRGWYSHGYLPHFDAPGLIQHITFHLADSLPHAAIDRLWHEVESLPKERQSVERRKRIQVLLDSGLGSCVLQDADCARIIESSLLFGDDRRYRLLAWVVMPNHVHVLIEQHDTWPLAKVVQSWKRHTSRKIHNLTTIPGWPSGSPSCTRPDSNPLWQRDYWDRFIRNEKHLLTTIRYIENNPVAAGLCDTPEEWEWSSASSGREGRVQLGDPRGPAAV